MSKYNMVCENCMHGNICRHVEDITEARKAIAGISVFKNEDSPITIAVRCDGFTTNLHAGLLN